MSFSKLQTLLLAATVTFMALAMIFLPGESFEASLRGLKMWWEIVFPSLFPFFVVAELLIGFGVVRFLGVLLEPLMRPLFRVPGVGGFAWAMGMATGFPAGAKLTARLRTEKQITRVEAERLVSFTNSSSPLFIFGAVAVGFFDNPRLGLFLAIVHYLGNFFVGLMMRFYGRDTITKQQKSPHSRSHMFRALTALHHTRLENKKPLGKLVGDAVISSIHTLLMIGGFIILFSVINRLLFQLNITSVLAKITENILHLFQLPAELSIPLIAGIFEITLGGSLTSDVEVASLMAQTIIVSFILGFSGLSVQAQVASILAATDIRFKPFFFARILHGFLSGFFAYLLWKPFAAKLSTQGEETVIETFLQTQVTWLETMFNTVSTIGPLLTISALILYIFIYMSKMKTE